MQDKKNMWEIFESIILLDGGFLVVSTMSDLGVTAMLQFVLFGHCPAKVHLLGLGGIIFLPVLGESCPDHVNLLYIVHLHM